jgi:hypothetical protein
LPQIPAFYVVAFGIDNSIMYEESRKVPLEGGGFRPIFLVNLASGNSWKDFNSQLVFPTRGQTIQNPHPRLPTSSFLFPLGSGAPGAVD